ncbi:enoyl-CoA hydratase [soil metagenome]
MATVRVDVRAQERVAVLTLDDPERRNALNAVLVEELVAAIDRLASDDGVGALVVTGAPPAFCAGADLGDLGSAGREGLLQIYEGFLRIGRSTLPTVAAVNGAAVGAGMNLALACDLRVVARRARFDTRFLDLGLHPGGGHTWMLRSAVGPSAAAALVLFGQVVDGADAERIGLAWRCVDDDAVVGEAVAVAARAASGPKELAAEIKRTLADMAGVTTRDGAVERELKPQLWSTRQPWFSGRLAALRSLVSHR